MPFDKLEVEQPLDKTKEILKREQDALNHFNKMVEGHHPKVKAMQKEIADIQIKINERKKELKKEVDTTVDDLSNKIVDLKSKVREHESLLSDLTTKVNAKSQELAEKKDIYSNKLNEVNIQSQVLQDRINEHNEQITKLKNERYDLNIEKKNVDADRKDVINAEKVLSNRAEMIDSKEQKANVEINAKYDKLRTDVEALNKRKAEFAIELEHFKIKQKQADEAIENLIVAKGILQEAKNKEQDNILARKRLEERERALSDYDNQLNVAERAIKVKDADIKRRSQTIKTVESKIAIGE